MVRRLLRVEDSESEARSPEVVRGMEPETAVSSGERLQIGAAPAEDRESSSSQGEEADKFELQAEMEEYELDAVRAKYRIPQSYICRLAKEGESVNRAEEGWIAIYTDLLSKGNFRLPLHPFLAEFLNAYELQPSLVLPNSWKLLGAFVLLCQELNTEPSLRLLTLFFDIKEHPQGGYFLCAAKVMKTFKTPSSTHPDRTSFFMCRPKKGWNFPTK